MNHDNQFSFGFSKKTLIYCYKCNLKYNKTNKNDVEFHRKIHRTKVLPNSIMIGDGLYQNKSSFYLVDSSFEILAKCSGKIENNTLLVRERESISEKFAQNLLFKLQYLFKDIKNYWKAKVST